MGSHAIHIAARVGSERSSIFDKMNRLAEETRSVNLGQGFPDFPAPDFLRNAALEVVRAGNEQYSRIAGEPTLREAVARYIESRGGPYADFEHEVTITCGCQEALAATLLALVDPGEEVIVFEPFFETYRLAVAMAGGVPRYVTLRPPDFAINEDELRRAFGPRTRAIIVNTPHNPTGRCFSRAELSMIARLCHEYDVVAITDEVYEELVFEGEHVRMASLEGMQPRTVTLSSLGKTFSVTGWKIGWAVAPRGITDAIRRVHQALAFSIAKPLQLAAVVALAAPRAYFDELGAAYRRRRDLLMAGLHKAGFTVFAPAGSYFLMADISSFGRGDDQDFCRFLATQVGVVGIPSSFLYENRAEGSRMVRFAFCKTEELITEAIDRLAALGQRV
jgi:N-succinyldiaminopimelate aminotransferase